MDWMVLLVFPIKDEIFFVYSPKFTLLVFHQSTIHQHTESKTKWRKTFLMIRNFNWVHTIPVSLENFLLPIT
jgi:hypothetical protein